MHYETIIAKRHLQSRKKSSVSVITVVCTVGVIFGVAALVSVLSVAGGFQQVFRDKVLGFNAHILVMKYGLDFSEYREVVEKARDVDDVQGASPFILHEMMITAGTELAGTLVKGVDPATVGEVSSVPAVNIIS